MRGSRGFPVAILCLLSFVEGGPARAGDQPEETGALRRARDRRLERRLETAAWDSAVRGFPSGIPPEAPSKALQAVRAMPDGLSPRPGGGSEGQGGAIQGINWFPIGPAPINGFFPGGDSGGATSIAVNPANVDEVWLGTAGGGVWHTTNAGVD